MKVAVLDDDAAQLEAIMAIVDARGDKAAAFTRAGALISMLRRETFDLLIVDWNLPDRSGLDVIRWARSHVDPAPAILLVTSRSDETDVIEGLDVGADDYLCKPISNVLLNARINALMRRTSNGRSGQGAETFAGYSFDAAARRATMDGEVLDLTAKEFDLALLLFRNQHRALSRAYMLEAVWGGEPGLNSRTLDVHVSRVRGKLNLKPERGFRLAPVYGYGYRLEPTAGREGAT